MKAAVVHALNDIRIEQVPAPRIGPDQILVEVGAAGVCSSDVKQLAGLSPPRHMPVILGHEVAGTIVEVGDAVPDWRAGQRVAVYPIAACGSCFFCRAGDHSLCEKEYGLGHGADGAFAELLAVPAEILALGGVVDIGDMPYEAGVLIEPLSCVLSAARQCGTSAFDTVAVVGNGPMGLLHVYASKRLGAKVIAIDMNQARLAAAGHLGADWLFNPETCDAAAAIRAVTEGRGADVVMVAVGFVDAVTASFPYVRKGGILNIFGGTPKGHQLELDPRWLHYGEIRLTGTFGSNVTDFRRAHDWLRSDPETAQAILSHRVGLDGIVEAVKRVKMGQGTKTVVIMQPPPIP